MTVFDWRNYLELISWWQAEYELHDSVAYSASSKRKARNLHFYSLLFLVHITLTVYVVIQWLSNVQHLQSHGL